MEPPAHSRPGSPLHPEPPHRGSWRPPPAGPERWGQGRWGAHRSSSHRPLQGAGRVQPPDPQDVTPRTETQVPPAAQETARHSPPAPNQGHPGSPDPGCDLCPFYPFTPKRSTQEEPTLEGRTNLWKTHGCSEQDGSDTGVPQGHWGGRGRGPGAPPGRGTARPGPHCTQPGEHVSQREGGRRTSVRPEAGCTPPRCWGPTPPGPPSTAPTVQTGTQRPEDATHLPVEKDTVTGRCLDAPCPSRRHTP